MTVSQRTHQQFNRIMMIAEWLTLQDRPRRTEEIRRFLETRGHSVHLRTVSRDCVFLEGQGWVTPSKATDPDRITYGKSWSIVNPLPRLLGGLWENESPTVTESDTSSICWVPLDPTSLATEFSNRPPPASTDCEGCGRNYYNCVCSHDDYDD